MSSSSSSSTCIMVKSTNELELPTSSLLKVVKAIFTWNVQDIKQQNSKIYITLNYTPREISLAKKFGNLPVIYERLLAQDEDDHLFMKTLKSRYSFDLNDEEAAAAGVIPRTATSTWQKPLPPLVPIGFTTPAKSSSSKQPAKKRMRNNKNVVELETQIFPVDDDDDETYFEPSQRV